MAIKQSIYGKLLDRFGGPSLSEIDVSYPNSSPYAKFHERISIKYKGEEKTFIFDLSGQDKIIVIEGYAFNLTFRKNKKNEYLTPMGSFESLTETPNRFGQLTHRLDKAINFEDVDKEEKPAYPGLYFTIMDALTKPLAYYENQTDHRVFYIKNDDKVELEKIPGIDEFVQKLLVTSPPDKNGNFVTRVNDVVSDDHPVTLIRENGKQTTIYIDPNNNIHYHYENTKIPPRPPVKPVKNESKEKKREDVLSGKAATVGSKSNTSNTSKKVEKETSEKNKTPVESKIFNPKGVGGELKFKIGVPNTEKTGFNTVSGYEPVSIELAPARQSFFDKQGQRVPGAGGGLEFRSRANLVKLNVPGSRPIYQHMGIAEETIEWVGAFVGFDHPDPENVEEDADHKERTLDAWTSSYGLLQEMRKGRELMIELSWVEKSSQQEHSIKFSNSVFYRGFIKDLKRTYATSQRVYYYVCFCITNREDLEEGVTSEDTVPVALPSTQSITSGLTATDTEANKPTPVDKKSIDPGVSLYKESLLNNKYFDKYIIPAFKHVQDNYTSETLTAELKRNGWLSEDSAVLSPEQLNEMFKNIYTETKNSYLQILNKTDFPVTPADIAFIKDSSNYDAKRIEVLRSIIIKINDFYRPAANVPKADIESYTRIFLNIKNVFSYFINIQRSSGYTTEAGNIKGPEILLLKEIP